MSNNKKFPNYVMKALRGRRGLDESDKSQDDAINQYTPDRAFRELCAWELGDTSWGSTLLGWVKDCGCEVNAKGGGQ